MRTTITSRIISGILALTMILSGLFRAACPVVAWADEAWNGAQRIRHDGKAVPDIEMNLMSLGGAVRPGDTLEMSLVLRNNTDQTVTDGLLTVDLPGFLENGWLEPEGEWIIEGTDEEPETTVATPATASEADWDEGSGEDNGPLQISGVTLQPGEVKEAILTADAVMDADSAKGNVLCAFYGNTEDGGHVSADTEMTVNLGGAAILPVEFADDNIIEAGEEAYMTVYTNLSMQPEEDGFTAYDPYDGIQDEDSSNGDTDIKTATPSNAGSVQEGSDDEEEDEPFLPDMFLEDEGGTENTTNDVSAEITGENPEADLEEEEIPDIDLAGEPADRYDDPHATPSDAFQAEDTESIVPRNAEYKLTMYGFDPEDVSAEYLAEESSDGFMATGVTFRVPAGTKPGLYFGTIAVTVKSGKKKLSASQAFAVQVTEGGMICLTGEAPDGGEVTVEGPASAFPEGDTLSLLVSRVPDELMPGVTAAMEQMAAESGVSLNAMKALDIKILADGVEAELRGDENVTVTFHGIELVKTETVEDGSAESADSGMQADGTQSAFMGTAAFMDGPEIFDESAYTAAYEAPEADGMAEESAEENGTASSISVWHYDTASGSIEEMPMQASEDTDDVVMTTNHFSIYVIVDAGSDTITVKVQHWAKIDMLDGVDGTDGLIEDAGPNNKRWDATASLRTKELFTEIYSEDSLQLQSGFNNNILDLSKIILAAQNKAAKNYKISEVWVLKNGKSADSTWKIEDGMKVDATTKKDWVATYDAGQLNASAKTDLTLTNDTVIRMVYEPVDTADALSQDVTFFDYNVGDGYTYNKSGTAITNGKYIKTQDQGINNPYNFSDKSSTSNRLAVGMDSAYIYHSNGKAKFGSLNLNLSNGGGAATGMVSGVNDNGPIYTSNKIYDAGLFKKTGSNGKENTGKQVSADGDFKLVFNQSGDTYTLTKVTKGTTVMQDNLHKFLETYDSVTSKSSKHIFSNNFWPLDKWNYSGRDPLFGGSTTYYSLKNDNKTYKALGESDDAQAHNWFFGMRYDFTFSVGDYTGPIYYYFRGDDDFWLFVDEELKADLGGIHSSMGVLVDLNDLKNGDKLKQHKITILYAERGGFGSCCYMQFTIPNPVNISSVDTGTDTVSITAKKTWSGASSVPSVIPDAYKPSSVQFTLQYSQKTGLDNWTDYETATVTAADGWTKTWDNLPSMYKYRVLENGVLHGSTDMMGDYTVSGTGTVDTSGKQASITIDNALNTTSVDAVKVWDDENDHDGVRPDSVKFKLQWSVDGGSTFSDFSPSITKTLTAADKTDSTGNTWKTTFTGIPTTLGGKTVTYRVREMNGSNTLAAGALLPGKTGILDASDSAGYTVAYTNNLTVKNTHTPVKTTMTVRKVWQDVPYDMDVSATAVLYMDGKEYNGSGARQALSKAGGWTYTWQGLYKYTKSGSAVRKVNYDVYEIDDSGNIIAATMDGAEAVICGYRYEVFTTESGAVTTITNRLMKAKLRIVKRVEAEETGLPRAGGDIDDTRYKFLIQVTEKSPGMEQLFAQLALADGEDPDSAMDLIPDARGIVVTITETVPMEYKLKGIYGCMTKDWNMDLSATTLPEGGTLDTPDRFIFDADQGIAAVRIMPGDDITVVVVNEENHAGYMHRTASVTNRTTGQVTAAVTAFSGFVRVDDYQERPGQTRYPVKTTAGDAPEAMAIDLSKRAFEEEDLNFAIY